jgi:archaemetzincin
MRNSFRIPKTIKTSGCIILVVMSSIDEHLLNKLKQELELTFKRKVEAKIKITNLRSFYNSRRNQYSSSQLLSRLRKMERNPEDKILGIVDVDLFSPGWEFIFGEAEINSGIGMLSLFRLKPENYGHKRNAKLLKGRTLKEAVHELGHLFGLLHCESPDCVMYFSTDLKYVDHKKLDFCSECQSKLNKSFPKRIGVHYTFSQ